MRVVLLTSDLMLMSAAYGAAARHSAELISVSSAAAALKACQDEQARLLAIDLRLPGLKIGELVLALRQERGAKPIHVLASGPHVHEQSLAAAEAAGCDEVVTRGEFDRRLDAAIARLCA